MTNIELFKYSGQHPEPIIDPYYIHTDSVVIPETSDLSNPLVENNARLIELISVFGYFVEQGKAFDHPEVKHLVDEVIRILTTVKEINLSPFSQFFMVYDSSHGSFVEYALEDQRRFVYEMLLRYGQERHKMYLSHGYSNAMLQVVSDSYSHKGKSKASITKICHFLEHLGFVHNASGDETLFQRFYFLPDKGDKGAFRAFKQAFDVVMESAKSKQDKLPDMVFFCRGDYYIVEMKHMKGSGGGQDKQLSEVIDFIKYSEVNAHIHYVTYLDGEYSNLLHSVTKRKKIKTQYDDAITWLTENPRNYFLNTAGFERFIKQLLQE